MSCNCSSDKKNSPTTVKGILLRIGIAMCGCLVGWLGVSLHSMPIGVAGVLVFFIGIGTLIAHTDDDCFPM